MQISGTSGQKSVVLMMELELFGGVFDDPSRTLQTREISKDKRKQPSANSLTLLMQLDINLVRVKMIVMHQ